MKTSTYFVILSILFLQKQVSFGENPCNVMVPLGDQYFWGLGGYLMPEESNIKVYSESNDQVFGTLSSDRSSLNLTLMNGKHCKLSYHDIANIGSYEHRILKTKACFNPEFVRIFLNSFDEVLYISKSDAEKTGAKYFTYLDALKEFALNPDKSKRYKIGVNLKQNCINIRKQPNSSAEKLKCALGNDWNVPYETIIELLEIKGKWAKVIYYELFPAPDYPSNDEDCYSIRKNDQIGWLKAIDDNGFPNLWFAVSGY